MQRATSPGDFLLYGAVPKGMVFSRFGHKQMIDFGHTAAWLGSIFAALSGLVYPPREERLDA